MRESRRTRKSATFNVANHSIPKLEPPKAQVSKRHSLNTITIEDIEQRSLRLPVKSSAPQPLQVDPADFALPTAPPPVLPFGAASVFNPLSFVPDTSAFPPIS